LEEGTPDHPGEPLETAEVGGDTVVARMPLRQVQGKLSPANAGGEGKVVQAAIRQSEQVPVAPVAVRESKPPQPSGVSEVKGAASPAKIPTTGTVVLDVEQGGLEVPSFIGKTVRGAVEAAQDAGLELEAIGSGVARQQYPLAGTHVSAGAHVRVQFGR
jgi:hypothetical protein